MSPRKKKGTRTEDEVLRTIRAPGDEWELGPAGPAPCRVSCPAGVDAKAYVGLIAAGRFAEALEAVKRKNPLPGICGRVCTHPCEGDCARGDADEPVAICALKRFAADWEVANVPRTPPQERPDLPRTVAVVGSGPAGLTVANDLARAGVGVTIFEKLDKPGGTLITGIPAYRLPRDVIEREIAAIEDLGVDIKLGVAIGDPGYGLNDLFKTGYEAVFLAPGAQKGLRLAVPGEDHAGVSDCLTFLWGVNLEGAAPLTGKVLVVGGGNSAIDAARTALRCGADAVTLVYRRTRTEMPANAEEVEEAEEEGVAFEFLASPLEVTGDTTAMKQARFQRMQLGEPDASGRRRPVPIEGNEFTLDADHLIVAISQEPDLAFLGGKPKLKVTKWNTLAADEATGATSQARVYAGGDVVTGPATVIEAIEAGHRAACAILAQLKGDDRTDLTFDATAEYELKPAIRRGPPDGRRHHPRRPAKERVKSFDEVAEVFGEDEARAEAARCLRCGVCAECVACIPACMKRLAVVRDSDVFPGESIVRVDTYDGSNPFASDRALFRAEGGKEAELTFTFLVARVDSALCRACGECVKACPYEAVTVVGGAASVDSTLCKGCGLCAGSCPTGAISPPGFADHEFLQKIRAKGGKG